MHVSTVLSCQCGQFHLELVGPPMASAQCFCASCRKAAAQLASIGPARPLSEDNGGTNYVMYRKDRVIFPEGTDGLMAYRLSKNTPTRRAFTRCCNTPVFLEFTGGHWLSLYSSLWPMAERATPQLRANISTAPANTAFDTRIPQGRLHTALFIARLVRGWAAMGFRRPKIVINEQGSQPLTSLAEPALEQSATLRRQ